MPSRWRFTHFEQCETWDGTPTIRLFTIYKAVILEAFFWGLGTAIGELPPYFVARAASEAGSASEELEDLLDKDSDDNDDLLEEKEKQPLSKRMQ